MMSTYPSFLQSQSVQRLMLPFPPDTKRVIGLSGSACGWLVSSLSAEFRQVLVVCKDRRAMEELSDDLEFFLGKGKAMLFPAWMAPVLGAPL